MCARSFNGTTDYLEFTLALSYPFTMACWFKPANATADLTLMAADNNSGSDNDSIRLISAGAQAGDPLRVIAIANGGTTSTISSTTGFTASNWHHALSVNNSATDRTVYLNGGSSANTTTSRLMTGLDRITLGAWRSAGTLSNFLNGDLAEIAVWNIALTAAEAALLATGLQPDQIRPASLCFYAPLVRDVFDYHGAPFSASSGTAVVDHPRIFR